MTQSEEIEQLEDTIIQLRKKISEQEIYIESIEIKYATQLKEFGATNRVYTATSGFFWSGSGGESSSGSDIPF